MRTRHRAVELSGTKWKVLSVDAKGQTATLASGSVAERPQWLLSLHRKPDGSTTLAANRQTLWTGVTREDAGFTPGAIGLLVEPHSHLSVEKFRIAGRPCEGRLSYLYSEALLGAGQDPANWQERQTSDFHYGLGIVSRHPAARVKWNVIGTRMILWSPRGPEFGKVEIRLDGQRTAVVDLHSDKPVASQSVWTSHDLPDSGHAVVVQGISGVLPVDCLEVESGSVSDSEVQTALAIRGGKAMPFGAPSVIGLWSPTGADLRSEGFRDCLDAMAMHSHFNLLTTTSRWFSMIDPKVHDWFKKAAIYAQERGIGIALELDPRHDIPAFKKRYPNALQERLWLQEVDIGGNNGQVPAEVAYLQGNSDAICRAEPNAMHLERVYSYLKTPQSVDPDTVKDITASCKVTKATARKLAVAVPGDAAEPGRKACIIARVTMDFPDIFSPQIISFEAETIKQYADVPLAGLMKDEAGFPAERAGNPQHNAFWFSRRTTEAYAQATGGRDLIRDSLLMWLGECGHESERQAAINQVMRLSYLRNTEIEQTYYRATKATFGPGAFVGTHDTTFPFPDAREFERNGMNWWTATRDFAQSDETTPYCCRTSMAKKFGGPVWYNMWYDATADSYEKLVWSYALAGGRMNFHVLWPSKAPSSKLATDLLRTKVPCIDSRIRLLNFISRAQVDCPVAVIFGHACAMNWAGPDFDDVGTELSDAFWRAGYYTDLIPTSEIAEKSLRVDRDGSIWFGRQRYAAVVLYHPEFEDPATAEFFQKTVPGKTILYRMGDWTRNFHAEPFAGDAALPRQMKAAKDVKTCADAVTAELCRRGIEPQTRASVTLPKWNKLGRTSAALPPSGISHLIDGTVIIASGENDVFGDLIQKTIKVQGHDVAFDAVGIAAVRLGKDGRLEAMAAGGLKSFRGGGLSIELPDRADVALWRDQHGQMHGVLQDWKGPVPVALLAITHDWLRLAVPVPLTDD
jgi:hypothetical protein